MAAKPLNVGLIGLDTSHVIAYAKVLNDPAAKEKVEGGKITVGFPGASPDFPLSANRVEGFSKDLREKFGVKIVDSPEAVAEAADIIFMTSVDGRRHLEFFRKIIKSKKPVFIDKPLATTYADAKEIARLAESSGVPTMTSSTLRYDQDLDRVVGEGGPDNPIVGVDVFGPVTQAPPTPHWVWYGVHSVEIAMRVLGPGCRRVQAIGDKDYDILSMQWSEGRVGVVHGLRAEHSRFGVTIQRKKDFTFAELAGRGRGQVARMLDAVLANLPQGKTAVPMSHSVEIIRILEAADQSRTSGKIVDI